jgi:hypothetical protein
MKKTERFIHFDDIGGRMARELREQNERNRAELAGVPTEEQKTLSRHLEEMIENARGKSHLQLPDR